MTTALQTVRNDDWMIIREQAATLVQTGFLPAAIKTPEQAVAIIMTGRELGIPTMAALRSIDVIQGKPSVSPQLMLALIRRSGQLEDMKLETGADGATCTLKRKGNSPYTVTFGPKEAKALGLDGKDNYKKQAATMYQWRAVAACARAVFPDVILGLYTPEEMGAEVDSDSGESLHIEAEVSNNGSTPKASPTPSETQETAQKKEARIRRICDLWRQEHELGGAAPSDEPDFDAIKVMGINDLEVLGKAISVRVNSLADRKAVSA